MTQQLPGLCEKFVARPQAEVCSLHSAELRNVRLKAELRTLVLHPPNSGSHQDKSVGCRLAAAMPSAAGSESVSAWNIMPLSKA